MGESLPDCDEEVRVGGEIRGECEPIIDESNHDKEHPHRQRSFASFSSIQQWFNVVSNTLQLSPKLRSPFAFRVSSSVMFVAGLNQNQELILIRLRFAIQSRNLFQCFHRLFVPTWGCQPAWALRKQPGWQWCICTVCRSNYLQRGEFGLYQK